jgi:small subunit ribosomal protein S7e
MADAKIVKEKGAAPDQFELEVGQALADLESNSAEIKAELRELYIVSAKKVDVSGREAYVLFVPYRLLKLTHKIQSRLVRELEKKFSGKHVVVIAQRRIQRQEAKAGRTLKQKRPVSRTLTSVHDAILEDLVYPTEIVGKHTRYRTDGSKLLKMCALAPSRAFPARGCTAMRARQYRAANIQPIPSLPLRNPAAPSPVACAQLPGP